MNYWILITPAVTAFTGWLVHKLAVTYFLNKRWPQIQSELASQAGVWAASRFSFDEIEQKISAPTVLDKAMPSIEKHIDNFLNEKLQQEIPMLSLFVGTKTTDKIKDIFINQLKQLFPAVMAQMAGNLKENFNIEKIISKKLTDPLFQSNLKIKLREQLNNLPLLGLVNGLVAGLVSLVIYCIVNNL